MKTAEPKLNNSIKCVQNIEIENGIRDEIFSTPPLKKAKLDQKDTERPDNLSSSENSNTLDILEWSPFHSQSGSIIESEHEIKSPILDIQPNFLPPFKSKKNFQQIQTNTDFKIINKVDNCLTIANLIKPELENNLIELILGKFFWIFLNLRWRNSTT